MPNAPAPTAERSLDAADTSFAERGFGFLHVVRIGDADPFDPDGFAQFLQVDSR